MKDGHSLKVGKLASLGLAGLSSVLNAILPTKDKAGLLTNEGWWLVGLTILMTAIAIILQAEETMNERDKQQKALLDSLKEQKKLYDHVANNLNPMKDMRLRVHATLLLDQDRVKNFNGKECDWYNSSMLVPIPDTYKHLVNYSNVTAFDFFNHFYIYLYVFPKGVSPTPARDFHLQAPIVLRAYEKTDSCHAKGRLVFAESDEVEGARQLLRV